MLRKNGAFHDDDGFIPEGNTINKSKDIYSFIL